MKSTLLVAMLSIFLAATFCQAQSATGTSQRNTPKDPTTATQGAGQAQSAAQEYFTDPLTDTPAKLKEYAKSFHAKPGWYFLSGKKENVDWALYKLGQYVENKDDHLNITVIGNEPTGLWKKAFGLAKSDELIKVVDSVVNDKVKDSN